MFEVSDTEHGGTWLVIGTDKISMDGTRGEIFLHDENGIRSFAIRNKEIDGRTTAISVGVAKLKVEKQDIWP